MSRVYDALKKLEAERSPSPAPAPAVGLDAIRLEQFVELQRGLLLAGRGGEDLPDRLIHAVATFLGVSGGAVGLIEGQSYRLLATYGAGYEDRSLHARATIGDSDLAPALVGGRPIVRQHDADGGTRGREVVVPFRGDVSGALHLVMPAETVVTDEKVGFVRVLAGLVGIALANARS